MDTTLNTMNRPRIAFPVQDMQLSALQQFILNSAIVEKAIPRGDIARRARVSPQTVMRAVLPMIEAGLLKETAQSQGQRGQPERNVEPACDKLGVIGVSIRAHQLHVLLRDVTGSVLWDEVDQTGASAPGVVLRKIETLLRAAEKQVPRGMRLLGAGVSVQGFFANHGRAVVSRSDPAGWAATDLRRALAEIMNLPLLIENDARILAGNYLARHPECLHRIFVLLDSGIGGGIISDGRLLRGNTSNAGEFGALIPNGPFRPTDDNMRTALGCDSWDGQTQETLAVLIDRSEQWFSEAGKRLGDMFYAILATTGITGFTLVARAPEAIVRALLSKVSFNPIGYDYIALGVPREILASPSVSVEPIPIIASAAAWAYLATLPRLPAWHPIE